MPGSSSEHIKSAARFGVGIEEISVLTTLPTQTGSHTGGLQPPPVTGGEDEKCFATFSALRTWCWVGFCVFALHAGPAVAVGVHSLAVLPHSRHFGSCGCQGG